MRTIGLMVCGIRCRHCVREVTARLRDVPVVDTVTAEADRSIEDSGRGPKELTGMVDLAHDQHGQVHARLLDLVPGRSGGWAVFAYMSGVARPYSHAWCYPRPPTRTQQHDLKSGLPRYARRQRARIPEATALGRCLWAALARRARPTLGERRAHIMSLCG
jgi:copper chaperone CopZ